MTLSLRFVYALMALILAGCAVAALKAAPAHAGTYEVVACDAAPEGAQATWAPGQSAGMSSGTNCPTNRVDERGIWAAAAVNVGTVPAFSAARNEFAAPPGASIVFLTAEYLFRRVDRYWAVGLYADDNLLHGCRPNEGAAACNFTTGRDGVRATFGFAPGVQRLYLQTACGSATGCRTDSIGAPFFERAGVRVYSAWVRIQDSSAPAVWDVGDGALSNGAWQRGSRHLGYAASDNVGIRVYRFFVDGVQRENMERACDYTRRIPCTDLTYARSTLDTRELPDGDHSYKVEVVDTAGNPGSFGGSFRVDNSAPDEPTRVTVARGEAWRQDNDFDITWTNPPSTSQIAAAHYELCNTATSSCTTGVRHGPGVSGLTDLQVPGPGDYTLRLWLGDEAGNANSANRSEVVHLRFDNVPPGEAEPRKRNGWLNAHEAAAYDQFIELRRDAFRPVSGIAGFSVTTDGSDPDGTIEASGELFRINDLPEGITTVKARAVSGAGVPSNDVGSTTVHVDKTRPEASLAGTPPPDEWRRGPVVLTVRGIDQAGLSGMAAALPSEPIEEGGYVSTRLDGGPVERVRGADHTVRVDADGGHVLVAQAVDVAGNESAEQNVRFKIDATAPELVVIEAPDPSDPRKVVVAASDRTSGIATGHVELRRLGDNDQAAQGAEWQTLETRRDGDRFIAYVDDGQLARGRYELRARVSDVAGNEAAGGLRRDGTRAILDTATLRADTKLTAALVRISPRRTRCVRRRCSRTPPRTELVASLSVPFGQRATARGTLEIASGGPIVDGVIDVFEKANATGSDWVRVGTVRTRAAGAFTYSAPAGVSRTLGFRYEGSPHHRSSTADVEIRVPAATTIRPSRNVLTNGRTVTFTGRLRGQPIPPGGKLLDLQAFYRGRWRTFATPRANARGSWRYRYRFEATRRTVTYRFRAVVKREAAYPYDVGTSRVVRVRVRGR